MNGIEPPGDRQAGSHGKWQRGPDDTIMAEAGALRLIVYPPCAAGYVRFLVMRRPEIPTSRCALLSSGSEESVQAAIRAAERTAARIALCSPLPAAAQPPDATLGAALEADPRPSLHLSGRRVLVVEDEWIIARDLEQAFRKRGAEVAGPVPSLDKARALLAAGADLDGAVLDVNLGGQTVYPLADALAQSGVPFVFATGYGAESIPECYAHVPRCYKPLDADAVARALGCQLLGNQTDEHSCAGRVNP
jgi:CheY-like chemotaxis protein